MLFSAAATRTCAGARAVAPRRGLHGPCAPGARRGATCSCHRCRHGSARSLRGPRRRSRAPRAPCGRGEGQAPVRAVRADRRMGSYRGGLPLGALLQEGRDRRGVTLRTESRRRRGAVAPRGHGGRVVVASRCRRRRRRRSQIRSQRGWWTRQRDLHRRGSGPSTRSPNSADDPRRMGLCTNLVPGSPPAPPAAAPSHIRPAMVPHGGGAFAWLGEGPGYEKATNR